MLKGIYSGKRVLVTGNTGFKGSWLTVWLLNLGAEVFGISKDIPTEPSMFEALGLEGRIDHTFENVCDLGAVKDVMHRAKPDYVFHLAAQPIVSESYRDPIETIMSNVMGTANILEALRGLENPCNAVMITSDKCYENVEWEWGYRENDHLGGKDIYSGSKAAAEAVYSSYARSFFNDGAAVVSLASARAGNVIGGGDWAKDRIIVDCVSNWAAGNPVSLRSPNATRPWQHVLEPLSGYLVLAAKLDRHSPANLSSFNFGPRAEQNATVGELVNELHKRWTATDVDNPLADQTPQPFAEAGLLKLNCDRALSTLGWQPALDLDTCIDFVASWYSQYYGNGGDMYDFTVDQIEAYESAAKSRGLDWAA